MIEEYNGNHECQRLFNFDVFTNLQVLSLLVS